MLLLSVLSSGEHGTPQTDHNYVAWLQGELTGNVGEPHSILKQAHMSSLQDCRVKMDCALATVLIRCCDTSILGTGAIVAWQ